MLIDAALNTILVAKACHIPLRTEETDEPKWDTASTDPETGDEEILSEGQQQVTVDVTSVITESKELYNQAMLPTFRVQQVFQRDNQEEIGLSKSDNDNAHSTPLAAISE